jgi:hypothetical protein
VFACCGRYDDNTYVDAGTLGRAREKIKRPVLASLWKNMWYHLAALDSVGEPYDGVRILALGRKMTFLEISFKICVTIVIGIVIYWQVVFLKWLWPSHIDVKATLSKFVREAAPKKDVIATRDPNKIYQNGLPVGNVIGGVKEVDDTTVFEKISETSDLKRDAPFEFKRDKLKIIKIEQVSAVDISNLTGSHEAVLKDVVCKRAQ